MTPQESFTSAEYKMFFLLCFGFLGVLVGWLTFLGREFGFFFFRGGGKREKRGGKKGACYFLVSLKPL